MYSGSSRVQTPSMQTIFGWSKSIMVSISLRKSSAVSGDESFFIVLTATRDFSSPFTNPVAKAK
eukprot:m.220466 g.220466  ORF g.220466 m.220466 type:complete len:64 (+) comp39942_c0_seq1:809-1000(+)